LRDGTPPNKEKPYKEKPFQTRKNLSKQGKTLQGKTLQGKTLQGKTFPNKKKHHQTRKPPFKQGNVFQASRGYLPLKYRSLQVVGVFRQGKAVVSDGGYGVIGGRYCLLVWGDAEETKGKRGRRWRGVGPAGRPFPILLWR
jgi:hypothetical protein